MADFVEKSCRIAQQIGASKNPEHFRLDLILIVIRNILYEHFLRNETFQNNQLMELDHEVGDGCKTLKKWTDQVNSATPTSTAVNDLQILYLALIERDVEGALDTAQHDDSKRKLIDIHCLLVDVHAFRGIHERTDLVNLLLRALLKLHIGQLIDIVHIVLLVKQVHGLDHELGDVDYHAGVHGDLELLHGAVYLIETDDLSNLVFVLFGVLHHGDDDERYLAHLVFWCGLLHLVILNLLIEEVFLLLDFLYRLDGSVLLLQGAHLVIVLLGEDEVLVELGWAEDD